MIQSKPSMRLFTIFLLILLSTFLKAQEFHSFGSDDSKSKPKVFQRWFVEAAGGVSSTSIPYQYSIKSTYLTKDIDLNPLPYLSLRVGVRLNKRHLLAGGWERLHMDNGFRYSRDQIGRSGIGLGASNETPYEVLGVYYEYNLLKSERFWLAPIVQLGIGWTDPTPHLWDSTSYDGLYEGSGGRQTFHRFEMVQQKEAQFVFVYGAGISTGVELLDDRLFLGMELKFIHAPAPRAKVYKVRYKVDQEPPLLFETYNEVFNLNFGVRLRYEF